MGNPLSSAAANLVVVPAQRENSQDTKMAALLARVEAQEAKDREREVREQAREQEIEKLKAETAAQKKQIKAQESQLAKKQDRTADIEVGSGNQALVMASQSAEADSQSQNMAMTDAREQNAQIYQLTTTVGILQEEVSFVKQHQETPQPPKGSYRKPADPTPQCTDPKSKCMVM
ncbi:MAG: hypothetical protein HON23_00870 [Rickettsiales bacterium]|nr:hypothetical protein [Rickettsiales bacterium]